MVGAAFVARRFAWAAVLATAFALVLGDDLAIACTGCEKPGKTTNRNTMQPEIYEVRVMFMMVSSVLLLKMYKLMLLIFKKCF